MRFFARSKPSKKQFRFNGLELLESRSMPVNGIVSALASVPAALPTNPAVVMPFALALPPSSGATGAPVDGGGQQSTPPASTPVGSTGSAPVDGGGQGAAPPATTVGSTGSAPVDGGGQGAAPPATTVGSTGSAPVDGGGQGSAPPATTVGSTGSPPSQTAPPATLISTLNNVILQGREELAVEIDGLVQAAENRLAGLAHDDYLLLHHPKQLASLESETVRAFTHDLNELVSGFRTIEVRAVNDYVAATKREATLQRALHNRPHVLAQQTAKVATNFQHQTAVLGNQFDRSADRDLAEDAHINHVTVQLELRDQQREVKLAATHPAGPLGIRRR